MTGTRSAAPSGGARADLEEQLLCALAEPGGLGEGLRDRLMDLHAWLHAEEVRTGPAPAAVAVADRLAALCRQARDQEFSPTSSTADGAREISCEESAPEPGPGLDDFVADSDTGAHERPAPADAPLETATAAPPEPDAGFRPALADEVALDLAAQWRQACAASYSSYAAAHGQPTAGADAGELIAWYALRLDLVGRRLAEEDAKHLDDRVGAVLARLLDPPAGRVPTEQDATTAFPDDVRAQVDRCRGRSFEPLLGVLAEFSWLQRNDSTVKIGYEPAAPKDLLPPSTHVHQMMDDALQELMSRLADTEPGSRAELERLVQFDAFLRGIVPDPLPEPSSWWMRRLAVSAAVLEAHPFQAIVRLPKGVPSDPLVRTSFTKPFALPAASCPPSTKPREARAGRAIWVLQFPVGGDQGRVIVQGA